MNKKVIQSTKLYFFILILSLCLQNVSIIKFSNFSFKLCHVVSLFALPQILKKPKIKLPDTLITIFFLFIMCISFINYKTFGIHNLILNYIFGYYLLIIILNLGNDLKEKDWLELLQKVASVMIILVYIRFITNFNYLKNFLLRSSANGHPDEIGTYFGGGSNLEATWIALLGFSFFRNKKINYYIFFSLVVSLVCTSRTGIILNLILFMWNMFQNTKNKDISKKVLRIIVIGILGTIAILILYKIGMLNYILKRMSDVGGAGDKGMNGRFNMWNNVLQAFISRPFGCGLGNAIKLINTQSSYVINDGNLHNIYLQMLLDSGLVGFIMYLIIIFKFLIKECKNFLKNPFVAFIITYLIAGLIQFRGGDSLLFLFIGIYLLTRKEKIHEENFESA